MTVADATDGPSFLAAVASTHGVSVTACRSRRVSREAVAAPDVHEQLVNMGLTVGYMTPEQLLAREKAYTGVWQRIIHDSGFKPL